MAWVQRRLTPSPFATMTTQLRPPMPGLRRRPRVRVYRPRHLADHHRRHWGAIGVLLHLAERHGHIHTDQPMAHHHRHAHDKRHQHEHDEPVALGTWHIHSHRDEGLTHNYDHYPNVRHRHAQ